MLITEEYRKQQVELHGNPNYGVASASYAPLISAFIQHLDIHELLDYGAGKGRLGESLKKLVERPLKIHHYDPAIPDWSDEAKPCDFVACIDVLEHIEPELLDNVLDDLRRVTPKTGIFTVHTGAAVKSLPDGRNAHLIQEPLEWWLPKLSKRFKVLQVVNVNNGFWVRVNG